MSFPKPQIQKCIYRFICPKYVYKNFLGLEFYDDDCQFALSVGNSNNSDTVGVGWSAVYKFAPSDKCNLHFKFSPGGWLLTFFLNINTNCVYIVALFLGF